MVHIIKGSGCACVRVHVRACARACAGLDSSALSSCKCGTQKSGREKGARSLNPGGWDGSKGH